MCFGCSCSLLLCACHATETDALLLFRTFLHISRYPGRSKRNNMHGQSESERKREKMLVCHRESRNALKCISVYYVFAVPVEMGCETYAYSFNAKGKKNVRGRFCCCCCCKLTLIFLLFFRHFNRLIVRISGTLKLSVGCVKYVFYVHATHPQFGRVRNWRECEAKASDNIVEWLRMRSASTFFLPRLSLSVFLIKFNLSIVVKCRASHMRTMWKMNSCAGMNGDGRWRTALLYNM